MYPQKFKKEWLKVPALSKWLCEIPTDSSKVHCRFCKCDILAKYCLLTSYSETKKHKSASPCQNNILGNFIEIMQKHQDLRPIYQCSFAVIHHLIPVIIWLTCAKIQYLIVQW